MSYSHESPNRGSSVLVEELAYEVKDWTKPGIGIVKPMFYARFSPLLERSGTKPELMLNILPGSEAHAFTVYFRNARAGENQGHGLRPKLLDAGTPYGQKRQSQDYNSLGLASMFWKSFTWKNSWGNFKGKNLKHFVTAPR